MATAPNVIPRSEATRESPKQKRDTVAIAIDRTCSRNHYRAENLCYQNKTEGIEPQFRKIVCLLGALRALMELLYGDIYMQIIGA